MGSILGFIYLASVICSVIIIILFPFVSVFKKKKERDRMNMHLFDNTPEDNEDKKAHSNGIAAKVIVIAAAVNIIIFLTALGFIGLALPIVIITLFIIFIVKAVKRGKNKNMK